MKTEVALEVQERINRSIIPVKEKINLTIQEAVEYSNIGGNYYTKIIT